MKPLIFALITISTTSLFSQVGVNESGATPHPGAILDVVSSTKGVLLPRTQASLIADPTAGMVIYDTGIGGFRYYNGMQWVTLAEEGTYSFWWADQDGDTYGNPFNVIYAPTGPGFYVGNNLDCNDQNSSIYPMAPEVCDGFDNDCDGQIDEPPIVMGYSYWPDGDDDGFGNPGAMPVIACTAPMGYVTNGLDCNDMNSSINPMAPEGCDMLDNDCDGQTDESPMTGGTSYWPDADNDGYGNLGAMPVIACTAPMGNFVTNGLDCNDMNSSINPGAPEGCDMLDNDCDGQTDESPMTGGTSYWPDGDNDGFGNPGAMPVIACTAPMGYVPNNVDCNDMNNLIYPMAPEGCDMLDNDCDGQTDESPMTGGTSYWPDGDSDGFGMLSMPVVACTAPMGYVPNGLDCNDMNSSIYPGAPEGCDGLDNDCDGQTDESPMTGGTSYWPDGDDDGFGNQGAMPVIACTAPMGYVTNGLDCNDMNSSINPGAPEGCDGLDNDCDGQIDECPGGGTCCGGICIDTQTDINNCGDCATICPDDGNPCTEVICVNGVCINQPLPLGTACTGGTCNGNGVCILDP